MEKTEEQKNRMTENCHAVLTTGRLRALLCEMLGVFFLEFFNTTSCINQLLLAGEKRMAGRAYFNFNSRWFSQSNEPRIASPPVLPWPAAWLP